MSALLSVENLTTHVRSERGPVPVVEGVSFDVPRGGAVALVGESGCGKTMTALSIMRLLPEPSVRIASGRILLDGVDLLELDEPSMRRVRGGRIGFVFQEPAAALDPVMSCGSQVVEAIRAKEPLPRAAAWERAVEVMHRAGIPGAAERAHAYPHELSGGLRQRMMIAVALAAEPDLLIADEPTAALDVTIQVQILELLRRLRAERSLSLLLITHDLAVAAEIADEVAVMYAGRIVEKGPAAALFSRPRHPYTRGLLDATPREGASSSRAGSTADDARTPSLAPDARAPSRGGSSRTPSQGGSSRAPLRAIPGSVPGPGEIGTGCRFEPRCFLREARCRETEPPLAEGPRAGLSARCWFSDRLEQLATEESDG